MWRRPKPMMPRHISVRQRDVENRDSGPPGLTPCSSRSSAVALLSTMASALIIKFGLFPSNPQNFDLTTFDFVRPTAAPQTRQGPPFPCSGHFARIFRYDQP